MMFGSRSFLETDFIQLRCQRRLDDGKSGAAVRIGCPARSHEVSEELEMLSEEFSGGYGDLRPFPFDDMRTHFHRRQLLPRAVLRKELEHSYSVCVYVNLPGNVVRQEGTTILKYLFVHFA